MVRLPVGLEEEIRNTGGEHAPRSPICPDLPMTVRWGLIRQLESADSALPATESMALAQKLLSAPEEAEVEDAEAKLLLAAVRANGAGFRAWVRAPLERYVKQLDRG